MFYIQLGYYGQFIVLQWRMKEAARAAWIAALPDKAFLRVSFDEIDAHGKWEEKGKECWYQGHLYDVIRSKTVGSTTWLFCLDDEREEGLIRQSDRVTRANQDHPDKSTGHSLAVSASDWLCERVVWDVAPVVRILKRNQYFSAWRLALRSSEIVLPPPKV